MNGITDFEVHIPTADGAGKRVTIRIPVHREHPEEEWLLDEEAHELFTFGHGALDKYGFWEFPCTICARDYERQCPGEKAWPPQPEANGPRINRVAHALAKLAEEGGEIVQDAVKAMIFGLDDRNILDPKAPNNRDRLVAELNDLLGVAAVLVKLGCIPENWQSAERQAAKEAKVATFEGYSKSVGVLVEDLGKNSD